jgi:hypothetical protein
MIEIGSCQAILASLSTKVDGSVKISFEINPDNQEIIFNLIKAFSSNQKLMQLGIFQITESKIKSIDFSKVSDA